MFNKKIIILSIFIIFVLSITAVSAAENSTDLELDGSEDDSFNSQIIAKDINMPYASYKEFSVSLKDNDGEPIDDVEDLKVQYKNDEDYPFDNVDGRYYFFLNKNVGNYKATIVLQDSFYKAKPVTINVKIVKSNVKLTAKKWVSTTKQYTTLKAIVTDRNGDDVDEGTVKFTINGKKYSVKVHDGVAIKKIRLTKAKNYNYKATFTSPNFNSKTVSSTVYVKQTKKYYTLKIRNPKIDRTFKVTIPYKKYVYLLNAKNKGIFGYVHVDTGIKRPPEIGGGHYYVGMSTNDEYHTYYGYPMHDYVFLRASSYLCLKKVNLYTTNF